MLDKCVQEVRDTPTRELLDRKGPSGATVEAHTPRIPKGRAPTRLPLTASRFHAGSPASEGCTWRWSLDKSQRLYGGRASGRPDGRREG
jgi:hypothetical protein